MTQMTQKEKIAVLDDRIKQLENIVSGLEKEVRQLSEVKEVSVDEENDGLNVGKTTNDYFKSQAAVAPFIYGDKLVDGSGKETEPIKQNKREFVREIVF